jgi:hypothetical protein
MVSPIPTPVIVLNGIVEVLDGPHLHGDERQLYCLHTLRFSSIPAVPDIPR